MGYRDEKKVFHHQECLKTKLISPHKFAPSGAWLFVHQPYVS